MSKLLKIDTTFKFQNLKKFKRKLSTTKVLII